MIVVHHLNQSRSQRVLWMLEELELSYDIQFYQRDPKTMLAPPSLRAVHPLGKSPVLSDGPVVVAESAAILEYLLETYGHGRFQPGQGTAEWRQYRYWMHYAEGSLMFPLLMTLVFGQIEKSPMPFFVKPIVTEVVKKVRSSFINPQLELHMNFLEGELQQKPWFAGDDFSAADIQLSFPIEALAARADFGGRYPKLQSFVEKIRSRPAYQRAIAKGGPFEVLS